MTLIKLDIARRRLLGICFTATALLGCDPKKLEPSKIAQEDVAPGAESAMDAEDSKTTEKHPLIGTKRVMEHLHTLLEHGRDRYGEKQTPLFMSVLDDKSLEAPLTPEYTEVKGFLPPDERAVGGANLWRQADLIRLLHRLSANQPQFATAADDHLTYYIDNLAIFDQHGQKDMLWWGDHLHYDAFNDQPASLSKLENQINLGAGDPRFLWERMWDLRPEVARAQTEAIWEWFVFDKTTGAWDRHAKRTGNWAVGFSQAGASYIVAFAVAYEKTGDSVWKDRAEKLRDHMWNQRDPRTNLIPAVANTCPKRGEEFWRRKFTSAEHTRHWMSALLEGFRSFGEEEWLRHAQEIMRGYLKYAWDPEAGKFYKWVRIDGVYDTSYLLSSGSSNADCDGRTVESGYAEFWNDSLNFRNNAGIALACLALNDASADPEFLSGAKKIADPLLHESPRSSSNSGGAAAGAWAGHYAAALEILRKVHQATGESKYLQRAHEIAEHGMLSLWNPQTKIFRGHSRAGYETAPGTDLWCEQLVELDAYQNQREGLSSTVVR